MGEPILTVRALDPFRTHPKNTHLLGDFWVWVHPFRTYLPEQSFEVGNPSHTYPSWVGFLKAKIPKIAPNTHRIPNIFGIFWVFVVWVSTHTHPPVRIFVRKVPNTHLPKKIQSGSKALVPSAKQRFSGLPMIDIVCFL